MHNMLSYRTYHQKVNKSNSMCKRHTFSMASHSHNKSHDTSTNNVTARTKYADANVFSIVPDQRNTTTFPHP